MNDTSGFYKNDDGTLLYGPNFVENRAYRLERAKHAEYAYPVDGWFWFNSGDEAAAAFGLTVAGV